MSLLDPPFPCSLYLFYTTAPWFYLFLLLYSSALEYASRHMYLFSTPVSYNNAGANAILWNCSFNLNDTWWSRKNPLACLHFAKVVFILFAISSIGFLFCSTVAFRHQYLLQFYTKQLWTCWTRSSFLVPTLQYIKLTMKKYNHEPLPFSHW